jgi:hypothetical protein
MKPPNTTVAKPYSLTPNPAQRHPPPLGPPQLQLLALALAQDLGLDLETIHLEPV